MSPIMTDEVLRLQQFIEIQFAGDPDWLRARRLESAERVFTADWPVRERTSLKRRKWDTLPWTTPVTPPTAMPPTTVDWLFVNGTAWASPTRAALPSGVIVMPLLEAARNYPDLVKPYLGQIADDSRDRAALLNAALWREGLFIYVPAQVEVDPIMTWGFLTTGEAPTWFARNLIVAEAGSRIQLVEQIQADDNVPRGLGLEVTEMAIHPGAEVTWGIIQQMGSHWDAVIRRYHRVMQDGRLHLNVGEFGTGLEIAEHVTKLEGPGATTRSVSVLFGTDQQHLDYQAEHHHLAPHTTSDMVARSVMDDEARSVFNGLTLIQAGARGSDGRQKQQALMLSDAARADAIPSLIIDERDVYAAHAASAGPLDKAALFYLMSRGLPESEARRLMIEGFLSPVIDSIPLESVREHVWSAVERKIRP